MTDLKTIYVEYNDRTYQVAFDATNQTIHSVYEFSPYSRHPIERLLWQLEPALQALLNEHVEACS